MNNIDKQIAANKELRLIVTRLRNVLTGTTTSHDEFEKLLSDSADVMNRTKNVVEFAKLTMTGDRSDNIGGRRITDVHSIIAYELFQTMSYLRPGSIEYLISGGYLRGDMINSLNDNQFVKITHNSILVNVIDDLVSRDHDNTTQKYLSQILQSAAVWIGTNAARGQDDNKRWVPKIQMLKAAMDNKGDLFTATGASEGIMDSIVSTFESIMSSGAKLLTAEIDQVIEIDSYNMSLSDPQNNVYGIDPSIYPGEYIKHYIHQ